MARIKYFNKETKQWEYADTALSVPYTLTEKDKTEIVQQVLAEIPTYNGGVS